MASARVLESCFSYLKPSASMVIFAFVMGLRGVILADRPDEVGGGPDMSAAGDDGFSFSAFDRFAALRELSAGVSDPGGEVCDAEPADSEVEEFRPGDSRRFAYCVYDGVGLRLHRFDRMIG